MRQIFILISMIVVLFAETEFSEPKPSMDAPRKIVFSIVHADDEHIHHVLGSANNVLKFYGPENVEMEIVAYSGGIRALLKKNKKIKERVETLKMYDVVFVACGNTMRTKKIKEEDLIEDTEVVTAGIVEIIEKVKSGSVYIKP